MLKFGDNTFVPLRETDLRATGLLERQNLQEAIVHSWRAFTKEIKIPDLQFIGKEVIAHYNVNDRIDILAFDPNENIPVIIELKRDRNKFQLLQGVSYAAMISSWSCDKFIEVARIQNSLDLEDIENNLSALELEDSVRIILIAERFDPEIIITADWFHRESKMDILAVSMKICKGDDEELYFAFEQKYPLSELHDSYDLRRRQRQQEPSVNEQTWEDIAARFKYKWGKEFLERCRREKKGDPNNGRIASFRSNVNGFEWITIYFRVNWVGINMKGKPEGAKESIQSKFRENIEVNEWRDGFSFRITTRCQYEDLCSWLEIQ